jgi:hypothetical protein
MSRTGEMGVHLMPFSRPKRRFVLRSALRGDSRVMVILGDSVSGLCVELIAAKE